MLFAIEVAFAEVVWRPYIQSILACTLILCGFLNGYITARNLKFFSLTDLWLSVTTSALALPVFVLGSLLAEMILDWLDHNPRRYRVGAMLSTSIGWYFCNAAMCYLGAYKGYT